MINRDDSQRLRRTGIVVTCIAGGLAAALKVSGCGWGYYTDHSVRFNGYRNATQIARLPRLPNFTRLDQENLFAWDEDVGYEAETYEEAEQRIKNIDALWDAAVQLEGEGNLIDERKKLQQYTKLTRTFREAEWGGVKDVQARRNSVFDKLDALGELDHGCSKNIVLAYLQARSAYDGHSSPEVISILLSSCRNDRYLRDNAAYLEAAVKYRDDKTIGLESFDEVAKRYLKSEKREAALYMSAVASMKASRCWRENKPGETDAPLRDKEWESARRGFQQVLREYPNGRYFFDSMGWLAHLWVRAGDLAKALAEYYRMLASDHENARAEAVVSLGLIRRSASDDEMSNLEALIADEPRTAMAYSYHEIYNYAERHCYSRYAYASDHSNREQSNAELKRIAAFASRMIGRYPSAPAGAGFVLRLAEAQLELENNAEGARLARRALAMGIKGEPRAEALWVAGAAEQRLGRLDSARSALETLVRENPNNRYTEGGRRLLATVLEDLGDLEGALDVYLSLDYRYDVAYFVDVLMTPEQLRSFIEKRPSLINRDEVMYALGIRYLRERQWREACNVFGKIKTIGRSVDDFYGYNKNGRYNNYNHEPTNPKELDFDPKTRGVRSYWVDQDLRTANDIERLERQVETAEGDEAKAEALYQVASYQFERSLLFYNPLAWKGIRHYLLVDLDHDGGFRQPGESQLLFNYMQKHDMAANSLPIFLEVVRRFPNTRAARDALFSAAVCHERLADYNSYWREIYRHEGHAGERMVTYRDVRAAYPRYRIPRGTYGWQPSTRTVNGGPGWDPLPKPKARPSRSARATDLANKWFKEILKLFNRVLTDFEWLVEQIWLGIVVGIRWVFNVLWILAMCGWLWFLWRRLREARLLMRESLARCKTRPKEHMTGEKSLLEVTPTASVLKRYLNQDVREQWMQAYYDLSYKVGQLVLDKRGISVVAFYVATHGLFAVLLIRLLVNL